METKAFVLASGEEATHGVDGEWYEPSVNPFGHGCCDCGLYHQVEWRLLDKSNFIVHEGHMRQYRLQLKFVRDTPETDRLRNHLVSDPTSLPAEISQLRHDLCNEQAASRMAHEVVARNRALEAENAQLRHALANAEVAAGFAKEMAGKVKGMQEEIAISEDRGFARGIEYAAKIAESAYYSTVAGIIRYNATKIQP